MIENSDDESESVVFSDEGDVTPKPIETHSVIESQSSSDPSKILNV